MYISDLVARRKRILLAVVDAYIDTALPVGSGTISRRLRLKLSSATIRNVMADLDELGFTVQPHTSAGRVPTDKGYRYYVDSLLDVGHLSMREEEIILERYRREKSAFQDLMARTSGILSEITNYTGMILSPGLERSSFKCLELISLERKQVLAVMVTTSGLVKSSIISVDEDIEQEELQKISRFLNRELKDMPLLEIKSCLESRLLYEKNAFFVLIKRAIELLHLSALMEEDGQLYVEGTSHILEQPEFRERDKMRPVVRAFEQKQGLLEIMNRDLAAGGINIYIGKENRYEDIKDCSLVVSNYKIRDKTVGTLGVIGPKRMDYSRVISAVTSVAKTLGRMLSDLNVR